MDDDWISNHSLDRDASFILSFPACHPFYLSVSGDRKQKRAKCCVPLLWHKSCFVFGITKVGSIIHQDWTKDHRAFTKRWDNGFPVDGAERLQTNRHTTLRIVDNMFWTLAYCCCCPITMQLKFWHSNHLSTWTEYLCGPFKLLDSMNVPFNKTLTF